MHDQRGGANQWHPWIAQHEDLLPYTGRMENQSRDRPESLLDRDELNVLYIVDLDTVAVDDAVDALESLFLVYLYVLDNVPRRQNCVR